MIKDFILYTDRIYILFLFAVLDYNFSESRTEKNWYNITKSFPISKFHEIIFDKLSSALSLSVCLWLFEYVNVNIENKVIEITEGNSKDPEINFKNIKNKDDVIIEFRMNRWKIQEYLKKYFDLWESNKLIDWVYKKSSIQVKFFNEKLQRLYNDRWANIIYEVWIDDHDLDEISLIIYYYIYWYINNIYGSNYYSSWKKFIFEFYIMDNFLNNYSKKEETRLEIFIEKRVKWYDCKYYNNWDFMIWDYKNNIKKIENSNDRSWVSFFFTVISFWEYKSIEDYKWKFELNKERLFHFRRNSPIWNKTLNDQPSRFNKFAEKKSINLQIINEKLSWVSIEKLRP